MLDAINLAVKNKIMLTGKLIDVPIYRVSMAGYDTAHFRLWHESQQNQLQDKLGTVHKVEFSIQVSVARQELINKLRSFGFVKAELKRYQVEVSGYLAQRVFANGEQKLVLHADNIEINY